MIRATFFVSLLVSFAVLFINSLKDASPKATFELISGEQRGSMTSLLHKSFHQCSLNDGCNFVARNIKTNAHNQYSLEANLPKDRKEFVIFKKKTEKILKIEILSAGGEDPGGSKSIIKVNGIDYSRHARGFNVVVLSGSNGDIISTGSFDTYSKTSEADRMIVYINSIQQGHIVLISVKDEAAWSMTTEAELAMHALGATTKLTVGTKDDATDHRFRGTFVLATRKGADKPAWFVEKSADRKKGPSHMEMSISLP